MMIIYIQHRKVDKVPKNNYERFYRGTAPLHTKHTDLLFFIALKKPHILKPISLGVFFQPKAKFTFLLNSKTICYSTNFTHLWGENHCTVLLQHLAKPASRHIIITSQLPVAGGTSILVWFIRAPFQVPFNSVYQTTQKTLTIHPVNSLCFTVSFLVLTAFNSTERLADLSCPTEKPQFGSTLYLNQSRER